ncbi:MAG: preprotein translocase subunit SecE [Candidatus Campbellbacteria bacterium]|nr:preprotein translocase subunit SecE [Candidatus Campbellbacteria bacterium]
MIERGLNYLRNVRGEVKHVSWPTQREIVSFTIVVIALSLLVAGMLGLFDVVLTEVIQSI